MSPTKKKKKKKKRKEKNTSRRISRAKATNATKHSRRAPTLNRPRKCLRSIIVTTCEHPGDVHEICNGYYISGSLDWYSTGSAGRLSVSFSRLCAPARTFHEPGDLVRRLRRRVCLTFSIRPRYDITGRLCIYLWPGAVMYEPGDLTRSRDQNDRPDWREKTPTSDHRGCE